MEIFPVKYPEKTERKTGLTGSGNEKLADLEKEAALAIGKNFIKASGEAGDEALEKMGGSGTPVPKTQPARTETEADGIRSDEAALSRDALRSQGGTEGQNGTEEGADGLPEERFREAWEMLEGWQDRPFLGLSQELACLKDVYHQLLEGLFEGLSGKEQALYTKQLNSLLLEAVGKVSAARYPALLAFLSRCGEKGAADILRFQLLKQISDNAVLISKDRGNAERDIYQEGPQKREEFPEGVLYRKGEGKGIRAETGYREHIRKREQTCIRLYSQADVRQLKNKHYTATDLERTERFLTYFTGKGDLFQRLPALRGNEALAGFLLAESMVKAQVYSEHAGVGQDMARDIRQAFQRLVDVYMNQRFDRQGSDGGNDGRKTDMSGVRRVYYHVIQLFMKEQEPGRTLEEGLKYAAGEFYGTAENRENRTVKKARQSTGFFSALTGAEDAGQDWEKGKKELERDWNQFLGSIGGENIPYLQWPLSPYSPWGMLLEPEKEQGGAKAFRPGMLLPLLGILLLLIVLVFLFQTV